MRRRIERAKEMLADGQMSVTEVALGAGFNGLTQLTRVFRQVVGVTPTTFRRDLI
jgi:AraC family transcriptional regulator